jgi:trk system potassium uptake protein TrkH
MGIAIQIVVSWRNEPTGRLTRREGFIAVVSAWVIIIAFGAIPFWISGDIPKFIDALFESASGYTTTGATILTNIEALPHAHLFQRSFSHWIGGMGIIVLSVAILPELAIGGMQLFSAESSGLGTDKLSPRIVSTARRLWQVYVGMTVVLAGLLMFGGMNLFDATCHSFGTIATGGFSTRNASIGAYDSTFIETIITIFMLLSGMSFALLYRLAIRGQPKPLLRSPEVKLYLGIFFVFATAICVRLVRAGTYDSIFEAARTSAFQTAAILTTTGYGTADFNYWPAFTQLLLLLLMFLGGCAGSTAGGVKVVRLLVVFKHATVELKKLLYPTLVQPVTVANRAVTQSTMEGILGFFLLYIMTTVGASMLVLATGVDLITGVTAVISAMNSIGPGLGEVGPSGNYSGLPDYCKVVLSVCMLVGRLEIYTIFVLFIPAFWHR